MAWTDIVHSCGHHDRVQLYGHHTSREREIEYKEKTLCSDCWKAEQDRRNEEAAKAAEVANPGLPALTGSPAQITWAGAIRAKAIAVVAQTIGNDASTSKTLADTKTVEAFAKRILKMGTARYWIDHRADFSDVYSTGRYIARRIAEEAAQAVGRAALGLK
jgi:hypothetical protein